MNKIICCFLIAISLFVLNSCKKNKKLPLVTTSAVQPGIVTAQVAGVIYDEGDSKVTEKGICWSEQSNVTVANNKIISTSQGSTFTEQISGLDHFRRYFARAYAINSQGVSYGKEVSFSTQSGALPDMNLYYRSLPGPTSVNLWIHIEQHAKAAYGTGVCWSTTPMPTIQGNLITIDYITQDDPWNYTHDYDLTIPNLNQTTVYYVRAFSTTGVTTAYTSQLTFTTSHF